MTDNKSQKKRRFSRSRTNQKTRKFGKQKKKWEEIDEEVSGLKDKYNEVEANDLQQFSDFPVSVKTKKGLRNGKYVKPTEIQRESILLALQGHDVLGAAKTGSGKTLAFLIPVLECLYRLKWTQLDGLGALIISPTRELAYQIFEVLRTTGKFHDFSAGLVIGGKHLKEEAERISHTNIVICTPGRLLQHMDQTVNFNADNLQILVLDEADRILDLGFKECMNGIIQNLPVERQTLLFSATQTKSVKDLARLSLKDPMYVSVHEHSKHSTPAQLQQSYIVCELNEKLDILWSFIKNHIKKKVLVFLSSCKQVRYVFETFRKLRPGTTVLALHGAMQQMKRVATYESFCRKQNAVLFATDIAARGLDFPAVHWVIQMDCPEDANTYIHRAGRTARYETDGEALLILLPTEEEAMIKQLNDKKIPIDKIRVNAKKMGSIQPKLESLCASEVQMKEFAQRAFMSYLKSVFFMSNKTVFDVTKLDTDSYARSLGLAIPPRIRFLQKEMKRQEELKKKQLMMLESKEKSTINATENLDSGRVTMKKKKLISTDEDTDSQNEMESGTDSDKSENGSSSGESDNSESESEENESSLLGSNAVSKKLIAKNNKKGNSEESFIRKSDIVKLLGTDDHSTSENDSESAESDGSDQESESESESDRENSDMSESDSLSESNKAKHLKESKKDAKAKKILEKGKHTESLNASVKDTLSSPDKKKGKKQKPEKSEVFDFNVDGDDADDLFVVKSKDLSDEGDMDENISDQEATQNKEKKQKVLTKAAIAKKLLKKNIKVNSKIVFDEEGEAVVDVLKKPQASLEEVEDEADDGGISIEAAKRRMKEEDKVDKEIFRQKIKAKHKEARRKEKERRRAEHEMRQAQYQKEEQEVILGPAEDESDDGDEFHSEDEDRIASASPEESVKMMSIPESGASDDDLQSESDEADSSGSDDDDDDDDNRSHAVKRKGPVAVLQKGAKKRKSNADFDTGLSLMDDEALALKLLQS